jgi:hypothetical protein
LNSSHKMLRIPRQVATKFWQATTKLNKTPMSCNQILRSYNKARFNKLQQNFDKLEQSLHYWTKTKLWLEL